MSLVSLIIAVAVLIAAWYILEYFAPDPLIAKLCKLGIFVVALIIVIRFVLPLAGLSF